MKIEIEYNNLDEQRLFIEKAVYIGDNIISIQFNDGYERLVDFKPFLNKSQHPSIRKYLDEGLFSGYHLIDGNLNWNDYDMIFPVWDLYNGNLNV